jgi:hypothetical protein
LKGYDEPEILPSQLAQFCLIGADVGHTGGGYPVQIRGDATNINLAFLLGGFEAARFTSAGHFGIGTPTPTATLQVSGTFTVSTTGQNSLASASLAVDSRGVSVSSIVHINGSAVDGIGAGSNQIVSGTSNVTVNQNSSVTITTAGSQRMVVAANGNVGIGSVNPLGRVDVVASAGTNSNVYVRRSASTDQALFVSYPSGALSASNPGWYSGLYGSSSDWYLSTWDGTNTITRIEVTPVGHVGIGKVPGTNLDVSGTMSLSSASANSSFFTAYTGASGRSYAISSCKGCSTVGVGGFEIYDATAGAGRAFIAAGVNGWQTPSDRRLKKDIQTLSVLDKLGPVRGVSYKLKDSGKPQIGVIAQEVNQSFPLAARTTAQNSSACRMTPSRWKA